MIKDYKYSVISKTYITRFFCFLPLSTRYVRMSEGTFCRVEVHMLLLLNCFSTPVDKYQYQGTKSVTVAVSVYVVSLGGPFSIKQVDDFLSMILDKEQL